MSKEINGWINPKKEFIACSHFEHLKDLSVFPEIKDNEEIQNALNDVNNAKEGCEALEEAGEHGEWHSYEIAQSNAQHTIYEELLKIGYIRVGEWFGNIHFEGTKENHEK